jgi:hypothetical protein
LWKCQPNFEDGSFAKLPARKQTILFYLLRYSALLGYESNGSDGFTVLQKVNKSPVSSVTAHH